MMVAISRVTHCALLLVLLVVPSFGNASFGNDCLVDVVVILDRSASICCACSGKPNAVNQCHENPNAGLPKDQCKNDDGSFKWLNPCPYWRRMVNAVNTFTKKFKERAWAGSRLGVITFSKDAVWQKPLSEDLSVNLGDDSYQQPSGTYLHKALDLATQGNLPHRRVVLTITDGVPTKENEATNSARDARNKARLSMVAIGVSQDAAYMRSIVSEPRDQNYYPIESFEGLSDEFVNQLTRDVCDTRAPTPAPTKCEKDTRGECADYGGLCFSNTRGDTYCNRETGTCHCSLPDECAYMRSVIATKGGFWGVCRKNVNETRGEDNPLHWSWLVAKDIAESYGKAFTGSNDYDDNANSSLLDADAAEQPHLDQLLYGVMACLHVSMFLQHHLL